MTIFDSWSLFHSFQNWRLVAKQFTETQLTLLEANCCRITAWNEVSSFTHLTIDLDIHVIQATKLSLAHVEDLFLILNLHVLEQTDRGAWIKVVCTIYKLVVKSKIGQSNSISIYTIDSCLAFKFSWKAHFGLSVDRSGRVVSQSRVCCVPW